MNAPHFVCPFCGLLCDDLPFPGTSGLLQTACPKAAEGWAAIRATGDARVDGVAVAEAAAVRAASAALAKARRPLIGGLAGDVQMMRAALALADRCGARVVHANQAAAQRNLFALQSRGAVATTLAEAQDRNEQASSRCVGLTVETRPDWITPEEVVRLRRLGVGRVRAV